MSTILELLSLALRPDAVTRFRLADAGDIAVPLRHWREGRLTRIRARHLSFATQNSVLLPFLSVAENIALQRQCAGRAPANLSATLAAFGIAALADAMPRALSVGQQQRAALARALAAEADLLLLDEPTSALDRTLADQALGAVLAGVERSGSAALIVSHDEALIERYAIPRLEIDWHDDGEATAFAVADTALLVQDRVP
ncbi:MAG: ATP-binding cassette domain-containing protein [Pseudomonadota bacterium]